MLGEAEEAVELHDAAIHLAISMSQLNGFHEGDQHGSD